MISVKNKIPPIIFVALGALCVSFAAIFVKLLKGGELGPTAIGFWRVFFGAIAFFVIAVSRGSTLKIPAPVLKLAVAAGFVFFLDLYFWHRSINIVGAGIATILAHTQVFITAMLGAVLFKEKLRWLFWIAAVSAIGGVALLSGAGSDIRIEGEYLLGIVFGLLTGIVFASYIVLLKQAGQIWKKSDTVILMAWTSLFTGVFLLPVAIFETAPIWPPDAYSWTILITLALVAQVFGWWMITENLPYLPASRAGLTILVQPALATLWGVLIFAEQLTWLQMTGAVVTVTAIYMGARSRLKPADK